MAEAVTHPTGVPCEDCGGFVVEGLEPGDPADESLDVVVQGVPMVSSEWCTDLDCPSNHAVPGLHRVDVNRHICKVCRETPTGPIRSVLAHRQTH